MPSRCIGNPSGYNDQMGLVIAWKVFQVIRMPSRCIGNPSGSNARMGLVIAWETHFEGKMVIESQEFKQHKFERVVAQVSQKDAFALYWVSEWIYCWNGTRDRMGVKWMPSHCIGNLSGSNARMGLVIAWEVCQVKSEHILKGKRRLNLKTIQEAHVRKCCRTSESSGCIRLVFGNPSGSNARMGLVITWEMPLRSIGNSSEFYGGIRLVIAWEMHLRCIGNPSGFNGRIGLVIAWEVCQVMSEDVLNQKLPLNVKRIQEAQVRTCCPTSESDGSVRVVLGIGVGLTLEWDS
ncbi:uncharacterized protein G2W53_045018 [Senna tora]|uniref:Uncharacterized protein n=1 Tax=Senna tora TaxID=362788 RepID=A0A834SGQ4_9FABA|nr:uncharacterized protein G2W53_045018 [Senna tora]